GRESAAYPATLASACGKRWRNALRFSALLRSWHGHFALAAALAAGVEVAALRNRGLGAMEQRWGLPLIAWPSRLRPNLWALAAKSRQAEKILIPVLDILQSVPVLGFLSITVTGFIALFPGRLLGVECAAIFAIFTSQALNMTFSLYQSLRTVPVELTEAAR